ncbi:MAG: hypothetical protein PWQ55_1226 [Chloroflexota bacterium]|nr:hypothetical protein [Chloroflexota bacterium]
MSMQFDTKIAIVIREDLETWQKLNVTAFIASAVTAQAQGIIGQPYRDASGLEYLPMPIQPMMIFKADAAQIRKAYQRALDREVKMAIYTKELFATMDDDANRAAVAAVQSADLDLVGIAMRDERRVIDKVVKGLAYHP